MIIQEPAPLTKLMINGVTSKITNSLNISSALTIGLGIVLAKKSSKAWVLLVKQSDQSLSNTLDLLTRKDIWRQF
jgi:hypothetical protein